MNHKQNITGRAMSMPGGLALGGAVSMGITVLSSLLLAKLTASEKIPWENIGYGIMVTLLASSYLGAIMAHRKIKRQKMMVCLCSGLIYFLLLLSITALFFGGQYEAVGVTGTLVFAGCMCAALTNLHSRGGKTRKKQYVRR